MSLRKLMIFLIFITSAGLVGVVLINNTRILRNHFEQQERNNVYLNIQQVKNAINEQITFMDNASKMWAKWDDTYQFIQNGDSQYTQDNLQQNTYQNLNVDLIILVNANFEVVYGGVINKSGALSLDTPPEISAHLQPNDLFPASSNAEPVRYGLMSINNQPMMITSHPILKSDGSGPSRGTLLLGKYIDSAVLEKIGNLLYLSLEIYPIADFPKNENFAKALAYKPTETDPYFVDLTPSAVYGYALVEDVFEQPNFIMRVNRYPATYNSGLLVNNYLIISVIMISITFTTILILLIEFNVLNRIRQLSHAVQEIGISGDINKRLAVKRKDELSALALKINEMLDALERAHLQRRESENRFRTLVESMDDVVFTVERGSQQVHIYDRKKIPNAAIPGDMFPAQANILQVDLENELLNQRELVSQSFEGGSTQLEWSTQTDHAVRSFITTLSPIYNSENEITSVVGVSKDITGYKKLEQNLLNRINELKALFNISQQLLGEVEGFNIHEVICHLAVEQLGFNAAWSGIPSADGSTLKPAASYGLDLNILNEIALSPSAITPMHPAAIAYNQKGLRLFSYTAADTEQKTAAAIPLIQSGITLAVLVLIKTEEPYFRDESLPMVHSFANLSSMGMQNAYLFKQVTNGRERLKSLSKRMVEIQEKERREIALELHDEIGQVLTGLRFSVDMINSLPREKIKSQVELSVEIINNLVAQVRQMSLSLRPSMLDDLGIVPTLLWYFERYTSQTGIQVNFQPSNLLGQRFSSDLEITVFRVIQEALTNVARYANVETATVLLWCTDKIIGIQVEDAGIGFDQDRVLNSYDSKGLLGMRERVGFVGGQLQIVTQPGEGTCLTAEIPWNGTLERRKRDTGSFSR